MSKRVHPYSTPEPVSFSLDRENILSKIPKGTCVLCLLLSLNSHQFTAWRCFVRVRIIEILLRRPQPTRNTQATLATKSQLPDPPLLHLQHAKFAFRHNSFLLTFLPKRSLLLLPKVEQHSYFRDKTQPFGPFVWTLFFLSALFWVMSGNILEELEKIFTSLEHLPLSNVDQMLPPLYSRPGFYSKAHCHHNYPTSRLLSAEAATAALEPTAQQRTHMWRTTLSVDPGGFVWNF